MTSSKRSPASTTSVVLSAAGPLVAAAIGAPLISLALGRGPFWWLLVPGALLVLVSIASQVNRTVRDSRRTRSLEDERSELRRKLRDALRPIPELIAQMPPLSYAARAERLQGIAQASATALYMLVSPHTDDVRANVYTLESEPVDQMVWLAHVGRGQTPGPFVAGTPRGDAALAFIQQLQPEFYDDLSKQTPPGYGGTMSDYETYIAVPIWTDQSLYGMVTIDAPLAGSLTVGDQYMVELVAELMAAAFEVANGEDPAPTRGGAHLPNEPVTA
ncbi:GAF domain-containing protein [Subtercola sp. YIM 133946]|uniref:GAF domain-containing protein n=1 Tax=Subtercola sp. YIM 133946 TaxID=3118909 RepID=UPI002F954243